MHSGSQTVCLALTHMTCRISNQRQFRSAFFFLDKTHSRSCREVLYLLPWSLLFPSRARRFLRISIVLSKRPISLYIQACLARLDPTPTQLDSTASALVARSDTLHAAILRSLNPVPRLHSVRPSDATAQHLTTISLRRCVKLPPELL